MEERRETLAPDEAAGTAGSELSWIALLTWGAASGAFVALLAHWLDRPPRGDRYVILAIVWGVWGMQGRRSSLLAVAAFVVLGAVAISGGMLLEANAHQLTKAGTCAVAAGLGVVTAVLARLFRTWLQCSATELRA